MKKLGFILISSIFLMYKTTAGGEIEGKVKTSWGSYVKDAVVYIDKIKGKTFPPPHKHAIIDQRNLVFVPQVLPVIVGTTVEFLNSDDVLHNVFSPDVCSGNLKLGTWSKGISKSYTFNNRCVSTILCNVHPEMEAFIVVETPYYAVTSEDGRYVIKGVPPGKYTLKIWHKRLKSNAFKIIVPETGSITHDFIIHK